MDGRFCRSVLRRQMLPTPGGYHTKLAELHWYGVQAGASLGAAYCRKSGNRCSRRDILSKHQFYPAQACHSPAWLLLPVVPEKSAIYDFI